MEDKLKKQHQPQPIHNDTGGLQVKKDKKAKKTKGVRKFSWIKTIILVIGFMIIGTAAGIVIWYNQQLNPVGGGEVKRITIDMGMTPGQVGDLLEQEGLIKNSFVFEIYVRLNGLQNDIKAGVYRLSSDSSVATLIEYMEKGISESFDVTFYPGATLAPGVGIEGKYDVTTVLKSVGYSDEEIKEGLNDLYEGDLFDGKPLLSDLEGYIYGQTYKVPEGATVKDILQIAFAEFDKVIKENNLVTAFKKQGLSLYEGITLASIVQREAATPEDQKQIAQVFLKRLSIDMALGSDVTYQYIADKTGQLRSPDLDSPYNTRKYGGLPPGPISVPSLTALLAVASPASGDYLYFLAGDDGITYFAKTLSEHEANIINHCAIGCSIP